MTYLSHPITIQQLPPGNPFANLNVWTTASGGFGGLWTDLVADRSFRLNVHRRKTPHCWLSLTHAGRLRQTQTQQYGQTPNEEHNN